MNILAKFNMWRHKKLNRWDYVALLGSGAVFSVLSLCNMGRWSVWFDEAFGLFLIRSDYATVAHLTSADVHPPLYYWALKLWTSIFGVSEVGARSLSLFFMLVAILFLYLLVRRLFGQKAAIATAALLAFTPILLRYSIEARMYGMTTAIVAASTYMLVSAMDTPKRWKWVVYGLLVSAGMWTHYFTAVAFAAQWVWRYSVVRKHTIKQSLKAFFSKDFVLSLIVTFVAYLPWLFFAVKQLVTVQSSGFWISPIVPSSPFTFVSETLMYRTAGELTGWLVVLLWAIIIAFVVLANRTLHALKGKDRQHYSLFISMALIPLGLMIMASLPPLRPALVDRYIMPSAAFLVVLIAVTVALRVGTFKRPNKLSVGACMLVCIAMVTGVLYVYQIGNFNKDANDPLPIWPVLQKVWANTQINEPTLVASVTRYYEVAFYEDRAPVGTGVYFEAADQLNWGSYDPLRGKLPSKVYDTVDFARKNGGTIWYVGDWAHEGEPTLPKTGHWRVLNELHADSTPNGKSDIRAVEIQLAD